MHYRHVQWGFTTIPVVLLFGVILAPLIAEVEGIGVGFIVATVVFMVIMVAIVTWFSRLEVTVDDAVLTAAFGSGKPHRSVELGEMRDVRVVRNHWWYGFGVRKVRRGWMYNVWGLDAVEVERFDGSVLRIGTNDVDRLTASLLLAPRT